MGNYIEANVNLLLKKLPDFITYKNVIEEDDIFSKETEMDVYVDFDMSAISIDLDILYPHSRWYCGEELHYKKESLYELYPYPQKLVDNAN